MLMAQFGTVIAQLSFIWAHGNG